MSRVVDRPVLPARIVGACCRCLSPREPPPARTRRVRAVVAAIPSVVDDRAAGPALVSLGVRRLRGGWTLRRGSAPPRHLGVAPAHSPEGVHLCPLRHSSTTIGVTPALCYPHTVSFSGTGPGAGVLPLSADSTPVLVTTGYFTTPSGVFIGDAAGCTSPSEPPGASRFHLVTSSTSIFGGSWCTVLVLSSSSLTAASLGTLPAVRHHPCPRVGPDSTWSPRPPPSLAARGARCLRSASHR